MNYIEIGRLLRKMLVSQTQNTRSLKFRYFVVPR